MTDEENQGLVIDVDDESSVAAGDVRRTEEIGESKFELVYHGPISDGAPGWHRWALHQDDEDDPVLLVQWPNTVVTEVWDHMVRTWVMYWQKHS